MAGFQVIRDTSIGWHTNCKKICLTWPPWNYFKTNNCKAMKRVMCFRFRRPMSPAESELNFYFFELTYKYQDSITGEGDPGEEKLSYYMARDTEGVWKIVPETTQLPPWLYKFESRFGEAIDSSLGIQTTHLELWTR